MAKKRNCRRDANEVDIHKEAVRLRKMTDRQLVEAFERANQPTEPDVSLTWDNIYNAADGKAYGSDELTAKDEARHQVVCLIEDFTGKNIEDSAECVEDVVESYCDKWNIRFDVRGNVLSHEASVEKPDTNNACKLERLLKELSDGCMKGIGKATADKIAAYCKETGLI